MQIRTQPIPEEKSAVSLGAVPSQFVSGQGILDGSSSEDAGGSIPGDDRGTAIASQMFEKAHAT